MMDLLTGGKLPQDVKDKIISYVNDKECILYRGISNYVISQVLQETDLDHDGAMSFQEFERMITLKAGPEFLQ